MRRPRKVAQVHGQCQKKGNRELHDVARRRRLEILPDAREGTIEHDVWRSIHALEEVRTEEAGKTIRLARTRQAIDRKGVKQTVSDFVSKTTETEGFTMLRDRDMLEYSFEAVVLRHSDEFCSSVRVAAQNRLDDAGYAGSI